MRIFAYYKNHIAALAIVFILLMVQAFTDLMIPNLTSQIVDVGIQQSGVEHVAVDEMTDQTHRALAAMIPESDDGLFADSYEATDHGTWRLTSYGRDHYSQLDSALAFPLAAIHNRYQPPESSWSQMMDRYDDGEIDRAQVLSMVDEARSRAGNVTDDVMLQQGIAAARAEYEDLGYSLTDMQVGFLVRVGGLMLFFAALGAVMAILVGFVASRTGAKIGFDLRSKLFSRVVSFSETEINSFSAASLITRGTNDIQLVQMVSIMLIRMVLYAPILAIGGIIMVMVTNASMGWIIVVAIVLVFIVIAIVFRIALPKFQIMQKLIDRVNLVSREMLSGLPVIRAFDREDYEEARFDEASTRLMRTQLFTNRVMTFMMPVMMLIMNATSVAIVWIGGQYVQTGIVQTGDLIAFITYSMVIIMGFLMIGMMSIMLPRADVAAKRVNEVIACEPSIVDPSSAKDASSSDQEESALDHEMADDAPSSTLSFAQPPEQPASMAAAQKSDVVTSTNRGARVAFNDVSFSYGDSDEHVLESISFQVEPGQTLAIIGSTGSGKSTILKLLERFHDVSSGSITIDGVDVRDMTQRDLRSRFGYIPQQAFLFSGTIASNVAYGDETMGEDRIERALDIAQALDFVNAMEDGVDTEIAQGGTNVSGGQRQRLAIARALAINAQVLLFDDSFSALDFKTDAALRQRLASDLGGVTQIVVAQRISSIMNADLIVVLDEGRVVGQGTHEQLMETCSTYQEIALSQLSEEELEGGDISWR